MGLGFSVGKGVRLHAGTRGLGVSAGAGPVRVYQGFGGGRRSSRGPSLAAQERAVRQQQKLEQVQAAVELEKQLLEFCLLHEEEFPQPTPWSAKQPEPVNEREIRRRLESEELSGVSMFKLSDRKAAKVRAAERLPDEVAAEQQARQSDTDASQAELDDMWNRLVTNEPAMILWTLERAFEDNESPAAAVSCRESRADVVMKWPPIEDVVPETKPDVTPSGNPTIKKRPKTERAEYYLMALASNALATIKEAFASCPAINEIGIAVIREARDAAVGDEIIEPVFLGTATRAAFGRINWSGIEPIATLFQLQNGRVGMKGKGSNKTLFGLATVDDEEEEFLRKVASDLDRRVPETGIKGITLPIHVVT